MDPQIVINDYAGLHNSNLDQSKNRIASGKAYRDLSTVCIVPTRGTIAAKVVQNWMAMMSPMNQKFVRLFVIGMEVGEAYNSAVQTIIQHPDLQNWKYILTLEEDNMPPPDGLLKLYESMDEYDVVGGLYWTKGEGGQPMIYGDPKDIPLNFRPQIPQIDTVQEACGLGMGFNLFKMSIFKDPKLRQPWFKTLQEIGAGYSQDLYFYEDIRKHGYKVACDTRVKVGHYDLNADIVW